MGRGYARKLEQHNLLTMGDIARCSLGGPGEYYNEELLYRLFGINAELLIDHAWGWEPTTIADIKAYRPSTNSLSVGQVLQEPYPFDKARIVLREMADSLAMDLVDKGLVTDQVVLSVCYDRESLDGAAGAAYEGEVATDYYGRRVPKSVHGSQNLSAPGASSREIDEAFLAVYDRITDRRLLVRRMYVVANHVRRAEEHAEPAFEQLDLFGEDEQERRRQAGREREKKRQQAMLAIRKKYGKNAILPGTSYQEGATGRERNRQIGGHKA